MQKKERGNLAFGILFVLLSLAVIVLLGAVTVNLVKNGRSILSSATTAGAQDGTGESATLPVLTPDPQATATPAVQRPTVTPYPEENRTMPALDGTTPVLPEGESVIPTIFESVNESVLGVLNYQTNTVGTQELMDVYATGTGFVVSTEGYILTNQHVIEGAEKIAVMLVNGQEYEAKLIGADEDTDIAVLKIEAEGLKALPLGDSDKVRVGEYVLAIGNPIDSERLANTLTMGIISAKERSITLEGHTNTYLQTDAAVNYGNSGGPLLNLSGEVIGVTSAKTVTAGYDSYGLPVSAEGIGFALPINKVLAIMQVLVEKGSVERPAIGIMVTTLDEADAAYYGVSVGIYVESVVSGGPADKAGLKAWDRIVTVDGTAYTEHTGLVEYIAGKSIGDTLTFVVDRDGKELTLTIDLGNKVALDYDNTAPAESTPGTGETEPEK